jgi:hypothetical protein
MLIALPLIIFSTWGIAATAQTAAEIWRQKNTRIQYLEQQVAALETLKQTAEKGYKIAEEGIHNIEDAREEELNLHYSYFNSLEFLHPVIGNSPEISALIFILLSTREQIEKSFSAWQKNPWMQRDELKEIKKQYDQAISFNKESIIETINILEQEQLEMTDGERLLAIRSISENAADGYDLLMQIIENTNRILEERQSASGDIGDLNNIFP